MCEIVGGTDVGNHNPGKGGWPSMKYFNKDTGYDGKSYERKMQGAICDELGDEGRMDAYIREVGIAFGDRQMKEKDL